MNKAKQDAFLKAVFETQAYPANGVISGLGECRLAQRLTSKTFSVYTVDCHTINGCLENAFHITVCRTCKNVTWRVAKPEEVN